MPEQDVESTLGNQQQTQETKPLLARTQSILSWCYDAATSNGTSNLCSRHQSPPDLGGMTFEASAVFIFVILGAGQALAARASMADDGHTLPYDDTAAVALAEAGKLGISLLFVLCNDLDVVRTIPKQARVWGWDSMNLLSVALLYSFTNVFNYRIVEKLGVALFVILSNLKIVFTCLFMRLLIGKSFATLQWVAVGLLTLSAIVVKIPKVMGVNHEGTSANVLIGLVFLFISTASSGLAAVRNEAILKKRGKANDPQMTFMMKNAVLYFWGVALNLGAWSVSGKQRHITDGLNGAAVVSIGCLMGLGLACAVILRYLSNVARLFSSVAQVLLTVAASRAMPYSLQEGTFDVFYTLALVLLAFALVLYQSHASPSLMSHLAVATVAALCVGACCQMFDYIWTTKGMKQI